MKYCLFCHKKYLSGDNAACPECGKASVLINNIVAYAPELAHSGGGFKPEYFSELAALEANNFWFRARNHLLQWVIQKYCVRGGSFLEIGCGTGFVLSGLAKLNIFTQLYGSEIFIEGLSFAAKRVPDAVCMQMDACNIPFVEEFDAIGAFDVIEHIRDDEKVLQQIHRALKGNGLLIITVPQHKWLWSASDDYACHERRYTAKELEEKIRRAGFDIVRSTSFVSFLLPVIMASRLSSQDQGEYNPLAEYQINPVLNKVLEIFLMFEFLFIKIGINFLAGGSRLVIAKKRKP